MQAVANEKMKRVITAVLLYYLLSACTVSTFTSDAEGDPTTSETSHDLVQVGKRNFWEANAAMATVTGVTPNEQLGINAAANMGYSMVKGKTSQATNNTANPNPDQRIVDALKDVNKMMTRKNGIDGCDPGTQIGLFRLASAYCNRLVNDSAAWNNFVEQNFDGDDISTLSKSHIAAVMLGSLQTGSSLNSTQQEKSITTIVNYLNDTGTGDSVSKEMLFDVCTMILGSASTMLN